MPKYSKKDALGLRMFTGAHGDQLPIKVKSHDVYQIFSLQNTKYNVNKDIVNGYNIFIRTVTHRSNGYMPYTLLICYTQVHFIR